MKYSPWQVRSVCPFTYCVYLCICARNLELCWGAVLGCDACGDKRRSLQSPGALKNYQPNGKVKLLPEVWQNRSLPTRNWEVNCLICSSEVEVNRSCISSAGTLTGEGFCGRCLLIAALVWVSKHMSSSWLPRCWRGLKPGALLLLLGHQNSAFWSQCFNLRI